MKKAMLILSFFTLVSMTFGQEYEKVAGYLGKRFLIGGGVSLSPSRQPQNALMVGEKMEHRYTLNKIWRIDAQYAISTYDLIGLTFGQQQTSATISDNSLNRLSWGKLVDSYRREHTLLGIFGTPDIRDVYYGGYFKKYFKNKGSIAPIGMYFKVGASIHNYQFDFSKVRFITNSYTGSVGSGGTGKYENVENKLETDHLQISKMEFLAAVGKSRPITDRILLDFSMEAGLIPHKFPEPETVEFNALEGNPAAIVTIHQAQKRVYEVNYLKFTIGCSILIF